MNANKRLNVFLVPILLLGFLFIGLCQAHGQSLNELLASGDALHEEGDYYGASVYYLKALKIDSTRTKTAYRYAEACRLFFEYREALKWYEGISKGTDSKKYPDAAFWAADMNKSLGNYAAAAALYQQYLQDNPGEKGLLQQKARIEIAACANAPGLLLDSLTVRIVHLGADINTDFADFGALQMADSLLFFSSLQMDYNIPYESVMPGSYLTRLYQSTLTPAGLSKPKALDKKLNDPTTHNANLCFSADHQLFFFTRCHDERRPDLQCTLFMARLKNNKWTRPVALPEPVNKPGYTATQPCLAHTEKEDILFFVSERPGGMGGKDIWYSIVRKNKVHDPINVGSPVNTPGDEITPFYDNSSGTLYFSSNWHPGLGGFDVFKSKGSYNSWSSPLNVGYPLNTSYNDLYFTVNESDTVGYLTSNRPGSYFIKKETCCNDIYQYTFEKTRVTSPGLADLDSTDQALPLGEHIRSLLPLDLYFHNDEPDPASTSETTAMNYQTTVADYYLMKETYQQEYSRGLRGEAAIKARKDIGDFFEHHVLHGLQTLDKVSGMLLVELRAGKEITITLQGFTSPLNSAAYNKKLARRRIHSLVNYFREYQNGVFQAYLNPGGNEAPALRFIEEPIGEEQASALVSDNPHDKRNSVYSRSAALERRIQLLYYNSK